MSRTSSGCDGAASPAAGAEGLLAASTRRDLQTLQVVPSRLEQLAAACRGGSAGGRKRCRDAADARRVAEAGYDLALVGSALMSARAIRGVWCGAMLQRRADRAAPRGDSSGRATPCGSRFVASRPQSRRGGAGGARRCDRVRLRGLAAAADSRRTRGAGGACARPGPLCVAVTRHPSQADLDDMLAVFKPDVLQTDAEDLRAAAYCRSSSSCFRCFARLRMPRPLPARLLFEGPTSGSGELCDWTAAQRLARRTRSCWPAASTPSNVATAIRAVRPFGVDVSSGVEERPGVKSPAKMLRVRRRGAQRGCEMIQQERNRRDRRRERSDRGPDLGPLPR